MQRTVRKILRAVADYDPDYYDMYADENEALFARLYLERIRRHAEASRIPSSAAVLEAGCQAGRLAIPLAKLGYRVTGIDTSGFALRRAREHAKEASVSLELIQGDLIDLLHRHPEWRYDMIVCAEVLYLSPTYRDMLQAMASALRPGGLLCVSHRPKGYYVLEAIRQHDFGAAVRVLQTAEGPFRDSAYYNWQTEDELKALYRSLGLRWVAMWPIDCTAWLTGLNPSRLGREAQEQWLQLELRLSPAEGGLCARYLLVIAEKPR